MSEKITSEQKKEDWMNTKWRPMMGWTYMLVCVTDFVIFPVLWSLLQALDKGSVTLQWQPITLQGAGLFHMAMGAVLGVAAWSRGQEKIAGVATSPPVTPPPVTLTTTVGFNGTSAQPQVLAKPQPQPQQEL